MAVDLVRELRSFTDRELIVLEVFLRLKTINVSIPAYFDKEGGIVLDSLSIRGVDTKSRQGQIALMNALESRLVEAGLKK